MTAIATSNASRLRSRSDMRGATAADDGTELTDRTLAAVGSGLTTGAGFASDCCAAGPVWGAFGDRKSVV